MRVTLLSSTILFAAAVLFAGAVQAQNDEDPSARLRQAVDAQPVNGGINTLLVFTNLNGAAAKLALAATDERGERVGAKELEVPGNGLAFVLVSELVDPTSPNRRLVGRVEAKARGRVNGSAFLFGGPFSDLPAINSYSRVRDTSVDPPQIHPLSRVTFPVVAAN